MDNVEIAKKLFGSFERFRRFMKGPPSFTDLKGSEMGLLFMVRHGCSPDADGIKVSELSSKMHVTSPSVTQLVTSLEEKGLVLRTMDKDDRRSVIVSLTDKGLEITRKAEERLMGALTGLVDYLGPEKSESLIDIMNDVFTYFQQGNNKGVE